MPAFVPTPAGQRDADPRKESPPQGVFEDELQAHFGITEIYGVVAVIPIGCPAGRFGPVTLELVESKIYSETWGGQSAR